MQILGPKRLNRALGRNLVDKGGATDLFSSAPLDLRFAQLKTLDPRVTFTRASTGTYVGADGLVKTATTNEARFDHNPTTGESLGLLVEEARTNSIRNNTMVGAVAGTPGTLPTNWTLVGIGGISSSIIGTGTENGITYIDVQVNGTPTASSFVNLIFETNITASSGQAWTSSIYVKLAAGSLTNTSIVTEVREVTAIGTFLANSTLTVTPTSAALNTQRASLTRTLNNALTTNVRPIISFQTTNGAAINITLRIGLPQLEQGAFATSVIPTTSATVTRAADVASVTGSNFSSWYNQTEGTVFADWVKIGASNFQAMATVSDGTTNNVISLGHGSGAPTNNARFDVNVSGSTQASLTLITGSIVGTRYLNAGAYKANDFAAASNGGTPLTDATGTIPTTSQLVIGANGAANGGFFNGTIKRLTYWPVRLANLTLQSITTP